MEISKEKINTQMRGDRLHFDEFEASFDRRLKTANKSRNNRRLFFEGLTWCNKGNRLEDANDEIKIENTTVAKKDNISFKRGYEEGIYQNGFRCGYEGVPYESIPELFSKHEKCKIGYQDGKDRRVLDDLKKEAKSRR